jgi:hypothetical protein
MRLLLIPAIVLGLAFPALAEDNQPAIKMIKAIEQDDNCANPNGNEIKAWVHVKAPPNKYFSLEEIHIITEPGSRSFTDKAEPSGCSMKNPEWNTVRLTTKDGSVIPVSVLRGFDVYGHADCGSGEARTAEHIVKGERIVMMCSIIVDSAYDMPIAK